MVNIRIWGDKCELIKQVSQKFDQNSTLKVFKSIVLNYTDNKPFLIRFDIDNECSIKDFIRLSEEFHQKSVESRDDKNLCYIDVWTDIRYFDLCLETIDPEDGMPMIQIPKRNY